MTSDLREGEREGHVKIYPRFFKAEVTIVVVVPRWASGHFVVVGLLTLSLVVTAGDSGVAVTSGWWGGAAMNVIAVVAELCH